MRVGAYGAGQRGVALLMVLWIFMVLTVLVGEFSRGMRDDSFATHNLAEENQARGVAMAGMSQAIYRALQAREHGQDRDTTVEEDEEDEWEPNGNWHEGTYAGGTYAVRLFDEGGKIGLNRADEALLRRVFRGVGLGDDAQEEVVDAILDWRDRDSLKRLHGAEAEYYLSLPRPYPAKDGRFDSVEELTLVRGIDRDLFFGTRAGLTAQKPGLGRDTPEPVPLEDVFSVYNRGGNINVQNAPEAVLRVLLDGEEADVQEVLEARSTDPASALTLMRAKMGDPTLARRLVEAEPHTLRIEARGAMENGHVEARVGAVIDLNEDGDGFHIVRWSDRLPAFVTRAS